MENSHFQLKLHDGGTFYSQSSPVRTTNNITKVFMASGLCLFRIIKFFFNPRARKLCRYFTNAACSQFIISIMPTARLCDVSFVSIIDLCRSSDNCLCYGCCMFKHTYLHVCGCLFFSAVVRRCPL